MSLTTSPPRSTRSTILRAKLAADPVWPQFGPIPSAFSGDDVPPKPFYSTLSCINYRVARAGIEPATFRFSVGSDCGTSTYVLVRPDKLDQQAVVEPVVPRLTADKWRINSTSTLRAEYRAPPRRRVLGSSYGRPLAAPPDPRSATSSDRNRLRRPAPTLTPFPDLSAPDLDPGSLCHRGNLVIGETRLQGTHMRTFRGLPPTGRRIDMPLVAIFVFDGPDLLCERVYWDRLTLFIQLGVARDPNTRAGKLATLLNHR